MQTELRVLASGIMLTAEERVAPDSHPWGLDVVWVDGTNVPLSLGHGRRPMQGLSLATCSLPFHLLQPGGALGSNGAGHAIKTSQEPLKPHYSN